MAITDWLAEWWDFNDTSGNPVGSHRGFELENFNSCTFSNGSVTLDPALEQSLIVRHEAAIEPFQVLESDVTLYFRLKVLSFSGLDRDGLIRWSNDFRIETHESQEFETLVKRSDGMSGGTVGFGTGRNPATIVTDTWYNLLLTRPREGYAKWYLNSSTPTKTDAFLWAKTDYYEVIGDYVDSLVIGNPINERIHAEIDTFALWKKVVTDADIATIIDGDARFEYTDIP